VKRALITGIFGQDGSYLAELLSKMEYEVHGVQRAAASEHSVQLRSHLANKGITPAIHSCDLSDYVAVRQLLEYVQPAECYHLAAVHYSAEVLLSEQLERDRALFEQNSLSTLNLLCAIQEVSPRTRFVLAGSCMMYDDCETSPQDGTEPFRSRSLYGLSKIAASQLTEFFRAARGLHASTAILYNHESPRRQAHFVTRKIVQGLVKVTRGQLPYLELGNLQSVKDWGYARDYVHGMWLMAQADAPGCYILATGRGHRIEDFVRETADLLGIKDPGDVVRLQAGLTRPAEQVPLIGNPHRACRELGWSHSVNFRQLVELMVEHELRRTLD
jgi:GDPmannose 4,6-dehydratase